MEKKTNFAFDRTNYILLAVGMAVVILGFVLMSGDGTTEETFNKEIFSALRIRVAPILCFSGFIFIIYAIMHKPQTKSQDEDVTLTHEPTPKH